MLQVREGRLQALLWQRAREPFLGAWSLPGGYLEPGETLEQSIRGHLAQKVDVRELAHLEQLETLSDPDRNPLEWELATRTSGSSRPTSTRSSPRTRAGTRSRACPSSPSTTARSCWPGASGCGRSSRTRTSPSRWRRRSSRSRSCATLYVAALGHEVSATNLQRVLLRRGVLEPTGERREPGRTGGRPAACYRFRSRRLEITDQFAVLRPPG